MSNGIALLKTTRSLTLAAIKGLSQEQLERIPKGFNNNILWNVGHVIVTHQLLTYALAGQALKIDESLVPMFRKGSSPDNWASPPDSEGLKAQLTDLAASFETDYQAGLFTNYKDYQTSTGPLLKTIDDAIAFNTFHEGLHLGYILALKKLV